MKLAFLLLAVLVSGCTSASRHEAMKLPEPIDLQPRDTAYVISHYSTEIVLTERQPRNERFGFELKRIEADGRVTIFVPATGAVVTASVGGYFVTGGFGLHGLELTAVDADARSATFVRRWAEHREEKIDRRPNQPVQSNSGDAPRKSGAVTAISCSPRSV